MEKIPRGLKYSGGVVSKIALPPQKKKERKKEAKIKFGYKKS